jgi:hypothetical protein
MPAIVRDRLAAAAAGNRLSVVHYLAQRLGMSPLLLMTPAERAAQREKTRAILREWNGYDPTPEEEAALDAQLDRKFAEARARRAARLEK